MRVFLTTRELETAQGQQLLSICRSITEDGRLDLDEIKLLRRWLRTNSDADVVAIPYLVEILDRITADGVIDPEELKELHLAVERVIPSSHRQPSVAARQARETDKKNKLKERRNQEKEAERERQRLEKAWQKREREAERVRANRIKHTFAKVAGVSFPNHDGSDRQRLIKRCKARERLFLKPDKHNPYSDVAVKVLRENGDQIGHAPEYLAERISQNIAAGKQVAAFVSAVTGGTWSHPTRGVIILVLFISSDVASAEISDCVNRLLDDDSSCQA